MSLRHQIEILYSDYGSPESRIRLLREVDATRQTEIHEYVFADVIGGFQSFLTRDEAPINREGILENIKSLEKLGKDRTNTDSFGWYLSILDAFVTLISSPHPEAQVTAEDLDNQAPVGPTLLKVFKRSQSYSGLGAALGRLVDSGMIVQNNQLADQICNASISDPNSALVTLNVNLLWIKSNARKIGNAQRTYFFLLFRALLNPSGDTYLDLETSASFALKTYQDLYAA